MWQGSRSHLSNKVEGTGTPCEQSTMHSEGLSLLTTWHTRERQDALRQASLGVPAWNQAALTLCRQQTDREPNLSITLVYACNCVYVQLCLHAIVYTCNCVQMQVCAHVIVIVAHVSHTCLWFQHVGHGDSSVHSHCRHVAIWEGLVVSNSTTDVSVAVVLSEVCGNWPVKAILSITRERCSFR